MCDLNRQSSPSFLRRMRMRSKCEKVDIIESNLIIQSYFLFKMEYNFELKANIVGISRGESLSHFGPSTFLLVAGALA